MAHRRRQAHLQAEQAERERLAREEAERERLAREQAEREQLTREEAEREQAERQQAEDEAAQRARAKAARPAVEPLILVPPELAGRIAPRPPAPTLFEMRRRQVCRRNVRVSFDNVSLT